MKNPFAMLMAAGTLFIAFALSCSKKQTAPSIPPVLNNVKLGANVSFGNILTDSLGRTLYFFSFDANGQSSCTGGCLAEWPLFYNAHLNLAAGLDTSDFSTITRKDGLLQTTYKGWPLYYFKPDSLPGIVKGDPVGNVWFVAKPDYTVMLAKAQLIGEDGNDYDSTYKIGTGLTSYLTDAYGRTLYSFSFDKSDTNHYTKSDFSNNGFWPIDTLSSIGSVPSIIDKSLLGKINVFGETQLVFKQWPLYRFGPDSLERGKTKGISVPSPGTWPAVDQYSPSAPL